MNKRKIAGILLSLSLLFFAFALTVKASVPQIRVLTARGTVNPVLADYIERGINEAEKDGALLCIIRLDTPGGLDTAMRDIVKSIVNSRIPVAVYVSPAGARAASAGVFITVSAHIAAMAPNTAIGAASPVALSPGSGELPKTLSEKIVNDAAAYIRSLAQEHERNVEWAEKAVREAVSATSEEALSLKVIDLVSPSVDNLISTLDGREVKLLDGRTITLNTRGAIVENIDMTGIEGFLHTIADPNIAYILLTLAFLGIMVEIFNPPLIFPGVIGAIAGLLAFYALGMLPVNYAGVLFVVLAFALFIAEVFTPGFGLLTGGGIISLIIGSLIMFKGNSPFLKISPWLIAFTVILFAGAVIFTVIQILKTQQKQPSTGKEELIGKTARAITTLSPDGLVMYRGERWKATAEEDIEAGQDVIIKEVHGLTLRVTNKK